VRRAALAATVAAAALATAATAAGQMDHAMHSAPAAGPAVSIGYASVAPTKIELVTGETVTWTNDSTRQHTVTADDGSFTSATLIPSDTYSRTFTAEGAIPYYCKLHPGIRGEVDVHDVVLDAQPLPAAPGKPFPLRGRTMAGLGGSVTIEGDDGTGFAEVASGGVSTDGSFAVTVTPRTSTSYRAVIGDKRSAPITLAVLDRTVNATATRAGKIVTVTATVTPAAPGATVVLQLRLPERFGWWPVQHLKLDKASKARFRLPLTRRVPARVALTLADGATRLATTPALAIPAPPARRGS